MIRTINKSRDKGKQVSLMSAYSNNIVAEFKTLCPGSALVRSYWSLLILGAAMIGGIILELYVL
jgi:hypothetical protein